MKGVIGCLFPASRRASSVALLLALLWSVPALSQERSAPGNTATAPASAASPLTAALGAATVPVVPTGSPLWVDPVEAEEFEPAPLVVWNRQIVVFRSPLGMLNPAERAAAAVQRINSIPHARLANPVAIGSAEIGRYKGVLVTVGTEIAFGLLPADVDPESGQTLEEATAEAAERLREVLRARLAQRSLPLLIRGIALSLAATLAFAGFVWMFVKVERLVLRRLAAATARASGEISTYVSRYAIRLGWRLTSALAWVFALFYGYLWLTFVLSQFPYTQPWGKLLGKWLLALASSLALGMVNALPGLVAVAIIFLITRAVVRMLNAFFESCERGNLAVPWLQPDTVGATRRIVNLVAWLFAIVVAYPYIPGSQSPAFKGVSVLVGLMISLGSAGLVNQLMSGLAVAYSRSMRPGEYVRVGDVEGVVSNLGLLSTKIRSVGQEEVTVPNAVVVATNTTNYSRLAEREGGVVKTSVTIGYDAPWRQVHQLLQSAAEQTRGVRKTPPPRVLQRALSDFYVEYQLLANVDDPRGRLTILSELHAQIQDAFNEAGVQIMSPHFLSQPERPVVVPRSKWNANSSADSNE
jgi:small-conductance mechanosensitive channel